MARVTLVEGRQAGPLLRVLNWGCRRLLGKELVPLKVLAHNPRFLLPYVVATRFVQGKTRLSPEVRTLALHLIARLNRCAWCVDFAGFKGLQQGIAREKLAAVTDYAANPLFSPAERAALAFAEAVTCGGGQVPEGVFAELRKHFSEREIVELAVAAAAENFFSRLHGALGIEAQGFCAVPLGGPLAAGDGAGRE